MTLRESIEELVSAWLTNDALRASAFFAVDGVYREAGRDPIAGREAIFAHFVRFFRDGPPWRFEVEEVIVEGERAAIAYRFGTKDSLGEWRMREGCALVRREGGLLVEWREYHG